MMKTRKELLITYRDQIAARSIMFEADALYWKKMMKNAEKVHNEEEKIHCSNAMATNQGSVKKDKLLLESIDDLLGAE